MDVKYVTGSMNAMALESSITPLKKKILKKSKLLPTVNKETQKTRAVYKPPMEIISGRKNKTNKYIVGKTGETAKFAAPEKVIMLVGATGSGKTTLINGLVNYLFGVDWEDSFRFKMIMESTESNQASSQTTNITSYTLFCQRGFPVPYTLTVVDTPGFGDTKGLERDREIIEQIRTVFTSRDGEGIDHIDAIGFVAKASENRLTPTQRYIFDKILSLFGKDIEKNIFLLATFADGFQLQLLDAVREAKVPHQKIIMFNNSALYASPETANSAVQHFGPMFWKMSVDSYKVFLEELRKVDSKSLTLTREVLNERKSLETYVEGINYEIQIGLTTLERLSQEIDVILENEEKINKNKNFTYEVREDVFEKSKLPDGQIATNCTVCKRTCHEYCWGLPFFGKYWCSAMDWKGYCKICPNNCACNQHENSNYIYKLVLKTVKKTISELKEQYQEASKKKVTADHLVACLSNDYEMTQLQVLCMTEAVRQSLQRLNEIALRPNPLSTVGYIDIQVLNEENQARDGWQERVRQLKNARKEAVKMQEIADTGKDPLSSYRRRIEEASKKSESNASRALLKYLHYAPSMVSTKETRTHSSQ